MADTTGQESIRGIDIQKAAVGFAETSYIAKQFVRNATTSAREIRWYMKTPGTLDTTATTGMTASRIGGMSQLALPEVIEPSWTRMTSHIWKAFVESPWLAWEDIRDCDLDVLSSSIRDLTLAVTAQVDKRIYGDLSGSMRLSASMLGTSWGDDTDGNPVGDILSGSLQIRGYSYPVDNLVLLMNPQEYKDLLNWVINTKGSYIPQYASNKVETGVLSTFMGYRIAVSENFTKGHVVMVNPSMTAVWKSFAPITTGTMDSVGLGTKIRVWEEGESLVEYPFSGFVIKKA